MITTRLLLLIALSSYLACHAAASVVPTWVEGSYSSLPNLFHRHSVIEDSKGDLWLYGGNSKDCTFTIGELWKMNVRNNYTWSQIVPKGNTPGVRSDFYTWIDKNDNIYLFGGRSSCNDTLSDLWMFNTSSLAWSLIRASGALNRGTIGTASQNNHPGPRLSNAAWKVNDNELWLYGGGLAGLSTIYQDVWKFSLKDLAWTCMLDRGTTTLQGDAEYPGQKTYRLIATQDTSGNAWLWDMSYASFSIFSRLKLSTLEWTTIGNYSTAVYGTLGQYSSTTQPTSYHVGSIVYIGNNVLALTSSNVNMVLNQWYYDITKGQWALMFGPTDSAAVPAVTFGSFQQADPIGTPAIRGYFGNSVTRGNTWIIRGTANGVKYNDTWVFPINRCNTDISPCDVNAACTDHLGWSDCECNSGYEGNGVTCSLIVPPVAPPATSPVTPPVGPPVDPPVNSPLAQPVTPPVTPPVEAPVVSPVSVPTASPVNEPNTAPYSPPSGSSTPLFVNPIDAPLGSKPAPFDGSQVVSGASCLQVMTYLTLLA